MSEGNAFSGSDENGGPGGPVPPRFGAEAAVDEVDRLLRASMDERPLLTLGTAAGIGFVLGAGLPRGALTMLLGVGARLAGAWIQNELEQGLSSRFRESTDTPGYEEEQS